MSCTRHFMLGIAAAIVAAIAIVPQRAEAQGTEHWLCPDRRVSVAAPTEAVAQTVCRQSARAREILAACGITAGNNLSVQVTRALTTAPGFRRAGEYDPTLRRVRLLPFATYARHVKPRLGSTPVVARVLHASVAAHEIAHGIFHEHTRHLDLPETAHEYVAYVVQLSSLPADVQKALMEQNDIFHVGNLFVFSYFLLLADPERFALNAYRHFHQPENGCGFLSRLVEGKVHFPPRSD